MNHFEAVSRLQDDFLLAKQGNRASLDRLLERLRPQVVTTCYRLIGNLEDAEDAAQEALISIVEGVAANGPEETWQALVHRCAVTASLQAIHAAIQQPAGENGTTDASAPARAAVEPLLTNKTPLAEIDLIEASPQRTVATYESLSLVFVNVLHLLAPETRALYLLTDILGASEAQAASALQLSTEQTREQLTLARQTIQAAQSKLPRHPLLPNHPRVAGIMRRLARALVQTNPLQLTDLLDQQAALVIPAIGSFHGPEAIAVQFNRLFEVGLAPHATTVIEVNGQAGLLCYRKRREKSGLRFYPTLALALMITHTLPAGCKIVRIDMITDQKVVRKFGKLVPYRKPAAPTAGGNGTASP
ncbi:MAG: hypothetical protein ONB48_17760 [candidate division KSB1 bacterium]|nr:hypothetical protein [candidate division KSB1 bacterium]MDZ7275323.1 hypothetical protein [candidate division KSB1 bacterium]MDZ7287490.1 hypothetical protein [candidate division KSB1 bacterium]MDZ7299604.1 hypothetical protein [candidate division KSB1 bacterium]MDZ7307458.1 hypothetical protein [candidate division KSB1 bacterium]